MFCMSEMFTEREREKEREREREREGDATCPLKTKFNCRHYSSSGWRKMACGASSASHCAEVVGQVAAAAVVATVLLL